MDGIGGKGCRLQEKYKDARVVRMWLMVDAGFQPSQLSRASFISDYQRREATYSCQAVARVPNLK